MRTPRAQKIRLWIAGGCQAFGILIMMGVPTSSPVGLRTYVIRQDGQDMKAWSLTFLAAAAVLGGISLYKFLRPKRPSTRFATGVRTGGTSCRPVSGCLSAAGSPRSLARGRGLLCARERGSQALAGTL
jgi:hypothetical protein